jgi:8-oxo-dGTP diphosphatase
MWYRTSKKDFNELAEDRKLVSTCIVFRKKGDTIQVLLERRGSEPHEHEWCIPGGHIEKNEEPFEAAERELKEETHLDLDPEKFVYIGKHKNEKKRDKINYIFATEYTGNKEIKADSDAEYLEWIDVNKMPKLLWKNEKYINKAKKMLFFKD